MYERDLIIKESQSIERERDILTNRIKQTEAENLGLESQVENLEVNLEKVIQQNRHYQNQ